MVKLFGGESQMLATDGGEAVFGSHLSDRRDGMGDGMCVGNRRHQKANLPNGSQMGPETLKIEVNLVDMTGFMVGFMTGFEPMTGFVGVNALCAYARVYANPPENPSYPSFRFKNPSSTRHKPVIKSAKPVMDYQVRHQVRY